MPRATELDKKIGKRILELRLSRGLSRESVAENVGVTHQQIAKYETGVNRLSIGRLLEVAEALGADPSYFYSDFVNKPYEDIMNQPRIRMNLELARNLQNIDNEEIQTGFLQLTKKIADKLKTNKENKHGN